MTIQIKATGFELTPALKKFVEDKFLGFEKYIGRWDENNSVILRVEIAQNTKHHQKGDIFYAELNMDLPKNVLRIEEVGSDMYQAVEKAKDRLKNDVLKLKDKEDCCR